MAVTKALLNSLLYLSSISGYANAQFMSRSEASKLSTDNTLKLSFPASGALAGAVPLSQTLPALSIEFCYIIDYLGSPRTPNELSFHLLENIQELLGRPPIIRIGGHTQDVARYDPYLRSSIENVFETGNTEAINVTFGNGLLEALNHNVPSNQEFIFGLNFGQNNVSYPLAEVVAVESVVQSSRISAYELGNEPDFYSVQRPGTWNVQTYVHQQEQWLHRIIPHFKTASHGLQIGALAQEPIYMGNFSQVEIVKLGLPASVGHVKKLSDHTYPFSLCDATRAAEVSLSALMNHTNTVEYLSQWASEIAAARSIGADFVMGETGSVSCHGKDGVSNTFGAALWEIDYMLHGATLGMQSIHFHMGTPFYYSMWQPVPYNGTAARVYPTYYSLVFVASVLTGLDNPTIVEISQPENNSLALYAVYEYGKISRVIAIDLQVYDASSKERPTTTIDISSLFGGEVEISKLKGPSSASTSSEQVTWKGQDYSTGSPLGVVSKERVASRSICLSASEAVIIERK